ncbi:hypothetical protein ACFFR3_29530 [Nonomuraea salmonea]|uniref:Uncharacterized protein n=1 Tax=Nonomuraea salmonea TaxID=46181 RepID=A0ABV5NUQ8_9ACTN
MTAFASAEGVRDEHVAVPLPDAPSVARLSFDNGLERVTLGPRPGLTGLLEARFGTPLPLVWAADANVHIAYPAGARLLRRTRPSALALNPAVPWALDVHGGAAHLDADLTGLDVRSVTFHSGAAHVRLVLGRPAGTRVIRLAWAEDLRVERPAGVPVRVAFARAVTRLSLDDQWYGAVGGGLTQATHRGDAPGYEVVVAGGADTVTVVAA